MNKNFGWSIGVRLFDKYGNLTKDYSEQSANSIVIAFADMIAAGLKNATMTNIKDTSGTNRTSALSGLRWDAGVTVATHGILVGTGTTAVALEDYNLETQIAHGISSGQLEHGAMTDDVTLSTSGGERFFRGYRTFTNNSGDSITIEEVAVVINTAGNYKMLIDRTLKNFAVADTASATVTYRWSVTV